MRLLDSDLSEFYNAKNSLLKYYSDSQISLGARFLGISVALFALVQAANWNETGLFNHLLDSFLIVPKLIPFLIFLVTLMFYIVRTIFRYASISGICNWLIGIDPKEIDPNITIHQGLTTQVHQKMISYEVKVFKWFPFRWFISGKLGEDYDLSRQITSRWILRGYLISLFIALFGSFLLFWILA